MARVKHVGDRHNHSARARGSHSRSNSFSHSSSNMSTEDAGSPPREATPTATASPPITSIPQKRALEDDHQPAISSPLNPDFKPQPAKHQDEAALARERAPRAKKESLKKRESKAGSLAPDTSARATPDPKAATSQKSKKHEAPPAPMRYKLPPPKLTDFEPPRGPIFIPSHVKTAPDGTEIQFNETTDQSVSKIFGGTLLIAAVFIIRKLFIIRIVLLIQLSPLLSIIDNRKQNPSSPD